MKSFISANSFRNFSALVIIILLFCLTYRIQVKIDTFPSKSAVQKIEDMKYLPSGKFLKGAALAYDGLMADLLWIKIIGYFGHHVLTDQNYEWFYHIIDITTVLDPNFQLPYEFGGIVLSTEIGDVEHSTTLLKKGLESISKDHPRYWYFPFLLAFNYMFYKDDYLTAAKYLEQASKFPKSPKYLPLLTSRLYANANDPDVAIAFLSEMKDSTKDEGLKKQLDFRIKEVMVDRDIRMLEKARDIFYEKWKRFPDPLNELVKHGIVQKIPVDPLGGAYYISQEDHSIQTTSQVKKLEIDFNKKAMQMKINVKE